VDTLARLGMTGLPASLFVVAAVCAMGLGLGHLKVRGTGLGVAGILFAGLFVGHFGFVPDLAFLSVLRDLGLLFFVYAIGAQLGPGFFDSLKRGGVRLNLLAAGVVLGGTAIAAAAAVLLRSDIAGVVGVLAGATTNTPSLGAAQQVIDAIPGIEAARRGLAGLGYAVAYPFGVAGIIGSLVILKVVFRVNPEMEAQALLEQRRREHPPVEHRSLRVDNPNLDGLAIKDLPGLSALGLVVSRVLPAGATSVMTAHATTVLHTGDVVLAVGEAAPLDALRIIVGSVVDVDLMGAPGAVALRRVVVTNRHNVGSTLADAEKALGGAITFTRLRRGEVELTARPDHHLRFGDIVHCVGAPEDLDAASGFFGNSDKALSATEFLPIFIGLAIGIVVGSIAVPTGFMPAPVALGLAGGPLLVAIILGRVGRLGPVVWYMPGNVNVALRELGMALFLSAVGLKAGSHIVEAMRSGAGPVWLAIGITVTMVPMLIMGVIGRVLMKLDYPTLSGVLAGSMTDPPALAFAQGLAGSDAPAVGYAAVYPLTMVLRIVCAQVLVQVLG